MLVVERQVADHALEHRTERLEHARAGLGRGGERRSLALVEVALHHGDRRRLWEVALVVLEDERDVRDVDPMSDELAGHLAERLQILFLAVQRRVGDEDDAVDSLEDGLAGRSVHRLTSDAQDLQPEVVAAEADRLERQHVEENRALLGGVHRNHHAAPLASGVLVQLVQVGRLAADGRPVVDDLGRDRPVLVVDFDDPLLACRSGFRRSLEGRKIAPRRWPRRRGAS